MSEVKLVDCEYCMAEGLDGDNVPAVDDDVAWADIARQHHPTCEWVLTRAHRVEVPE